MGELCLALLLREAVAVGMSFTSFAEDNVNTKVSIFNEVPQNTLEDHAPIRSLKIQSRPCSYLTAGIKDLMKARDQLHRRFHMGHGNDWHEYKEL